jgi:hypothetical protein
MIKISTQLKSIMLLAVLVLFALFTAHGQDKTKVIGNRPRSGSANSSFSIVKGNQVGVKMNAGHKPVQLLKLNFDVENLSKDSLKFKVNVYEFNYVAPGENLVKQDVIDYIPQGKNRVSVNLEPYHIVAHGNLLVAIEWLKNDGGNNSFAIGLFNGGTYTFEDGKWKKTPVAGVDFNVLVKKLK